MAQERNSERTLFVAGHKNPDTDAVCAAIAYADYKRRTGTKAKAFRAGNLNAQTKHVLDRFGIEQPPLLADVYPRVSDIMLGRGEIISMTPDQPLADAHRIMLARRFSFLPVADENNRCIGKVSLVTLVKLLTELGRGCSEEAKRFNVGNFVERTGSRLLDNAGSPQTWFTGEIWSEELCGPSQSSNSGSDRHTSSIGGELPSSEDAQSGPRCIIINERNIAAGDFPAPRRQDLVIVYRADGRSVDVPLTELVDEMPCPVIIAALNYVDVIVQLHMSMPVSAFVESAEPTFRDSEMLRDVEKRVNRFNLGGFIVLDDDGYLTGVLTRIRLAKTSRYRVALVDHNEFGQAVDGIEQAEVEEIVDHHRLRAHTTDQPITFINRVVGSTCTIIADMFRSARLTPRPNIAGAMLSAILSDTVILRSPTTTPLDHEIAQDLAGLAGVDIHEWGEEMFAAGTNLHEMEPKDIILQDQKMYDENGWRFAVSQIEMVGFKSFYERKDEIAEALERLRGEQGHHFACLLVSDIAKETSLLLFKGNDRIAEDIGYPKVDANLYELRGVLSRKKQLLPSLLDVVRAS